MTAQILDLTKALARPVVQRHLRIEHSYAAIAAAVARADRLGELEGSAGLDEQIDHWAWQLGQFLRREDSLRQKTSGKIRTALRPLIAARRPPNQLLAEAHNINADAGSPFAEREVTEIVSTEVWWAMRRAHRGGRNG